MTVRGRAHPAWKTSKHSFRWDAPCSARCSAPKERTKNHSAISFALQIETGGAFLYEEGGRIVSKAEGTMVPPYAALIGGVYTLPSARGLGHATACVAALCRHLLGAVRTVTLTAEPDNPAAYGMYMRIGFSRDTDWMVASFQEPDGE